MSFANINLGAVAGDHSGDPLRTAFDKINRNFAQVSLVNGNVTAGVYSVNARSGNVTLTISDIPGAVTIGNVSTIVQNNLTNYANLTYVNSLIPNVVAIGTQISTAIAAEDLTSIRGQISGLQSGQYSRDVDVDNLQLGNILLTSRINAGNTAITTANTAMKSYVDAQTSVITTAWTANAGAQANQIAGANAAIIAANIAMRNYVDAGTYGWEVGNTALKAYTDNQITTANTALKNYTDYQITTANTALKNYTDYQITTANTALNSYVDTRFTTLTGGASTALDTLLEIGTALGNNTSFSGVMVTWLSNLESKITGSNSAIVTANTALKSYTDGQIATTQSWVTGANAAIITANTAMKSYVDAQTSAVTTAWTANAASQAGLITTLQSNAGVQADAIALKAPIAGPSFTGNLYVGGNIVFPDNTYQSSASAGSGLGSRTSIVATPTVLTANVGGNINITGFKGYALYSIATSSNTTSTVWVTVYSNIAARVSDYSRAVTTDPTPGTGVIAEVINVGNVTQFFTPAVYGFNNEATANTNIPIKATVTSGGAANVTITVTMLKLEN
jgi:hypothetical protein